MVVKDMAVASFLLCSGQVRLVKTERINEKLVLFHFSPKKIAEKLVADFWSDQAIVSPRKVFEARRSLTDLIFSGSP